MKFAFLIMAHNHYEQLILLLKQLDRQNADIYLHIDAKSKIKTSDFNNILKNANLYVYKKFKVYWGDLSQTKCQLYLLNEALKSKHDYYHLLSGSDLLIKPYTDLEKFFCDNYGYEFVHFESFDYTSKESLKYYHFFTWLISRIKIQFIRNILWKLDAACIYMQKNIGINRKLYTGANWYSISSNLAENFNLHSKKMIRKMVFSNNSDECILQTYIKKFDNNYKLYGNSEEYTSIIRAIDWTRGKPYIWKLDDFNELLNSKCYFARKFDDNVDKNIICEIIKITNCR